MSEPRYTAMTVNERLFAARLMEEFDRAAKQRDHNRIIAVLEEAGLSHKQAIETAEALLANSTKYGY